MIRALVLAAGLMAAACTSPGGTQPTRTDTTDSVGRIDPREPVGWFRAASRLRRCYGERNRKGAFWSAVASTLGVAKYFQSAPRSLSAGERGRRRASRLALAGYRGELDPGSSTLSCAQMIEGTAQSYRRLSGRDKDLVARFVGRLLNTDATGRAVLADARARRGTYSRRTRRIRRSVLKPSEQQLPLQN